MRIARNQEIEISQLYLSNPLTWPGKSFSLNRRETENSGAETKSLDAQTLAYLAKNGTLSVQELYDALRTGNPSLTRSEITNLVWHLVEQKKVDVEDQPPTAQSLWEYLRLWERNISFYVPVAISLMTLLVIYLVPPEFPWVVSRWVLGSLFVLFIPGHVAAEALFPRARELAAIERLALSVGLSLALVPLIGFLLSFTPWGVSLTSIMISLTILTMALALAAFERRFKISAERFESQPMRTQRL